jgi:flagellar hook-associated protein 2
MAGIDGLISGLKTSTVIAQLMAVERLPKAQLVKQESGSQARITALQSLNTLFATFQTAAKGFVPDSITGLSAWTTSSATTSNSLIASALPGVDAVPGSTSFTVDSLARAGAVVSLGTVGALTTPVAGGAFLVSKGAALMGMSDLSLGAALSAGAHVVEVTQSSVGATLTGSTPLASSTLIDGTNNEISFYRDGAGSPTTITLNAGTYTPAQLAAEVAIASAGTITGSLDDAGGLVLSTAREGSISSLQLSAVNASLGLTDTVSVGTGVNGIVTIDGFVNTITSAGAGDALTLSGVGTDRVISTLSGGLRAGAGTTSKIDVAAAATLSAVVTALNGSGTGVTANAVQVSAGAYRLQISSTTTGSASDVTVSSGSFPPGTSSLGELQQLSAGTDTVLHVGTGPGAFDVTSSTTSVSGLMTGVTITAVKADPATTVTINVTSDANGIADKMAAMVASANSVLSFIATKSSYDLAAKTGGPLVGDGLTADLSRRIADAVVGTSSSTPMLSGVSLSRLGPITFDKAAFLAAYAEDPAGVTSTMTTMSEQFEELSNAASNPVSGWLTERVTQEQDSLRGYTKQIAAFEDRMTLRQQALQTQYAALESMLGKLQAQSQWLTAQLASLPTFSSLNE